MVEACPSPALPLSFWMGGNVILSRYFEEVLKICMVCSWGYEKHSYDSRNNRNHYIVHCAVLCWLPQSCFPLHLRGGGGGRGSAAAGCPPLTPLLPLPPALPLAPPPPLLAGELGRAEGRGAAGGVGVLDMGCVLTEVGLGGAE